MYKGKSIIAIIPARSGSKGIPQKNLYDINGLPLIAYTINTAIQSKYIDYIFVSTDSEKIANVASKYGANIPFLRPSELSGDESKIIDAVIFSIEMLKKQMKNFDYTVVLQPTQPYRSVTDVDLAIEKIIDNNYSSLLSVSLVNEHPVLMKKIQKNGRLENLLSDSSSFRRQEFEKIYKINGSIYINKVNALSVSLKLNDNEYGYIMSNKYDIDIDELGDIDDFKNVVSKNGNG